MKPTTLNSVERAREILDIELAGLAKVRAALDAAFQHAVHLVLERLAAGGKIVVTGIGKNLPVAEKISATLASTGATSVVLNPAQAMHGDLGILCPGDLLLVLSYSGDSQEIIDLIPLVRRIGGIPVLAFTGMPESALGRLADATVSIAVDREACPFNMAPTASTTATMALGDALARVVLEARGFRIEDYAKLHPAGAIGRTLLLRVADIMRKDDRLAVVRDDAKVKDALLAMTQARSGSAAVVDSANAVLGIFTDGDLRRHIAKKPDILNAPVREVMTPRPITVQSDALAVEVLRVFESHSIDDVLVVDESNRLLGAVDIQDLPKFKIM
jgi:arabinose-5-phosphate isomerase